MASSIDASIVTVADESNFVSRQDLLAWLNNFLGLNYTKVEQTASGAAHCQLMDALFQGSVPLHKVNFDAKFEHEFVANFKVLQFIFTQKGIQKYIDVAKLTKGRYLDNFEFLRWIKAFFDRQWNYSKSYDAVGRRKQARAVRKHENIRTHFTASKSSRSSPKSDPEESSNPKPNSGTT